MATTVIIHNTVILLSKLWYKDHQVSLQTFMNWTCFHPILCGIGYTNPLIRKHVFNITFLQSRHLFCKQKLNNWNNWMKTTMKQKQKTLWYLYLNEAQRWSSRKEENISSLAEVQQADGRSWNSPSLLPPKSHITYWRSSSTIYWITT